MRIIGPQPISGKVGTSAIADDAVTEAKVANDAISITEMKAGTDGNIISYDASGDPVAIATGNDGQVLTSTGSGSPPAFENASGGGTALVSTSDVTSNTTTTTVTGLDSSSDWWQLIISGCTLESISQPEIQYITSGGTQNSNYTHATSSNNQGSTGTSNNDGSATEIPLTAASSYRSGPENTIQIIVDIFDPATSQMTDIWWRMTGGNDNQAQAVASWGMGRREVDEAVTGISFSQSTGDHQARFTLYKWVLS